MKTIKLDNETRINLQQIYDEINGIKFLLIDLSFRRNALERQAMEAIEKQTKHKCTVYFDKKGKITVIESNSNE